MPSTWILIVGGAVVLAGVHLFAGRLVFLDRIPRSRWLSIASGSSVAYVFLHLMPELNQAQDTLEDALVGPIAAVDHHAYFVAALGLTVFYGLERVAVREREKDRAVDGRRGRGARDGVFWVHVGSFAVYNLLIGYLLTEEAAEPREYLAFVAALGLHFVVNDYALRKHHRDRYQDVGRWLLSAAVGAGALIGLLWPLPEPLVLVILAFIGGGIILNVLKEELPPERESGFGAFAIGMIAFAIFLAVM